MKNLVTRRRTGVIGLLVALMMCVAGVFASIAPAQAASGGFIGKATVVNTNDAGTEGKIVLDNLLLEGSLRFVVTSTTTGAHNYTVSADLNVDVPFGPDSGTITVQYFDPFSERWIVVLVYPVPTVTPTPTPTPTKTETAEPTPTPSETAPTPPADNRGSTPYTFCHRNHNRAESYEPISGSVMDLEGHDNHEGDILPPVDYVKQGVEVNFLGQNWDAEGIAIFNNGCALVLPSPSQTATPSPSETTTPTTTASPSPTSTETATASPSPTSTATASPSLTGVASAAPSETSEAAVVTTKVSRYAAAYVDTAVVGGGQVTPAPFLFVGAALIALLSGLLLRGESQAEHRRH